MVEEPESPRSLCFHCKVDSKAEEFLFYFKVNVKTKTQIFLLLSKMHLKVNW